MWIYKKICSFCVEVLYSMNSLSLFVVHSLRVDNTELAVTVTSSTVSCTYVQPYGSWHQQV